MRILGVIHNISPERVYPSYHGWSSNLVPMCGVSLIGHGPCLYSELVTSEFAKVRC